MLPTSLGQGPYCWLMASTVLPVCCSSPSPASCLFLSAFSSFSEHTAALRAPVPAFDAHQSVFAFTLTCGPSEVGDLIDSSGSAAQRYVTMFRNRVRFVCLLLLAAGTVSGQVQDQLSGGSLPPSATGSSVAAVIFAGTSTLEGPLATVQTPSATSSPATPSPSNSAIATAVASNPPSSASAGKNIVSSDTPGFTTSASPSASASSSPQPGQTQDHRTNLIIILCAILGAAALLLLLTSALLVRRCCSRKKAAVVKRQSSPIDDEEIETWRASHSHAAAGLDGEKKLSLQQDRAAFAPTEKSLRTYSSVPSIAWAPASPPQLINIAKAPNARSGLTDSSVPGADAFVGIPRRQSSKLQKPPPIRHKSSRLSVSGRPVTSYRSSQEMEAQHERLKRYSDVPRPASVAGSFQFDFESPVSPTKME